MYRLHNGILEKDKERNTRNCRNKYACEIHGHIPAAVFHVLFKHIQAVGKRRQARHKDANRQIFVPTPDEARNEQYANSRQRHTKHNSKVYVEVICAVDKRRFRVIPRNALIERIHNQEIRARQRVHRRKQNGGRVNQPKRFIDTVCRRQRTYDRQH